MEAVLGVVGQLPGAIKSNTGTHTHVWGPYTHTCTRTFQMWSRLLLSTGTVTGAHCRMLRDKPVLCSLPMRWSSSSTSAMPGSQARELPTLSLPCSATSRSSLTCLAKEVPQQPQTDALLLTNLLYSNAISA